MARSGVPCVHLMENSAGTGVYSVGFSQSDAGADLTRHLIARGKRRIAFAAASWTRAPCSARPAGAR
jgi:LacI family gluconate utilization system Gnt-I transcriptional repressor